MTENQNLKKDKETKLESQQFNISEFLKKLIKYVQENVGAFTFLTASAVAVSSVVLRFILYLIEYGKTTYYNISSSLIDVSGDNMLYDLFVKGVFALLIILLNLILFLLWRGESKMRIKVGCSLPFVLLPDLILIIYLVIDNLNGINYSILEIGLVFLMGFLLGVVLFFWGIYNGISEYRSKSNSNNQLENETENKIENEAEKKTNKEENRLNIFKICFIIFSLILVIVSLLFIYFGYCIANSQNQFKIINRDDDTYYAVIYENSDKYVITPCKIEYDSFDFTNTGIQQEIDRDGVEYQLMEKKVQIQ